jgi:hypothetical protein
MDLKNALAVCLISLFSATLVLLIARALDMQTASRLEPQLARIVEELEAIRKSGGIPSPPGEAVASGPVKDGLAVYYFHSNARCPTCRAIESQAREAVENDFASQLDGGQMVWKTLNYEEPASADLVKQFDIQMPVVVVAKMKDGEIGQWKRLDRVWALVGDKPAFLAYVSDEIRQMLGEAGAAPAVAPPGDLPEIPLPQAAPADMPLPTPTGARN